MVVTAFCMALGLAPEEAIADQNAHLDEISRRDSLHLDEVVGLRAMAGNWTPEYMEGWAAGFAEGRATAVVRILQGRGIEVTGNTWERVTACSDLARLTQWLSRAATVARAEDLFASVEDVST
ncbi:hypothetical protein [Streptomyces sp. NPDC046862]|uniref:hypothetical protein n=1 Tax=Streptomyces sp. NPDC046862 TaxID=3154603 RepID=UPI003451FF23